jgi:cation diffusion facilitator CzcD-associated flavoprotein CzcO
MKHRHPELFAGQTVALLGANYSGMDIALQLSNHAKKVMINIEYWQLRRSGMTL